MPSLNDKRRRSQPKAKAPVVVAFRCPPDLRHAIKVRAAVDAGSTESVCVAALWEYVGKPATGATA